ncbi:MAG: response regulator, partial [Deltaproteobacteria bacterium]|nr:response regulator [Deltaproteobacteria bacterium]
AVFGDDVERVTQESLQGWTLAAPRSWKRIRWWARSRRLADGLVLILLPERRRFLRGDPRIRMLLDLPAAIGSVNGATQRVLIVEAPSASSASYLEKLESVGCIGYRADTADLAIRLFESDSEIGSVLIDWDMPGVDPVELVARLREIRPQVRILGASERMNTELQFRSLGIGFLQKPWTAGDLIHAFSR